MNLFTRAGSFGAGLVLGVSGLVAVAMLHSHHDPTSSAKLTPAKSGSVRTISNTDPETAKRVYAGAKDSVAYISATQAQGQATGSGFVVSSDGKIVTNEHVVDGASRVTVRFGEHGKALPARVVGEDPSDDLAVLDVADSAVAKITPLTLGSSSGLRVGQSAIAIGSPFGLSGTLTSGVVSALGRDIQSPNGHTISGVVQTDAAINPGNSGGPLLDASGQVIGINSQIATESGSNSGVGFAIPIDTVRRVLTNLEA
jgi:putative serine protease PepD